MTVKTVLQSDIAVERFYLYGLGKVIKSKCKPMVKTVSPFCGVLGNESVGGVTIITAGDSFMAGVVPTIVIIPHYVAVNAGLGIIAKIGISLAIYKGETA